MIIPNCFDKFPLVFLSEDETTMDTSRKAKCRLFSFRIEKYGNQISESLPVLQNLFLSNQLNDTLTKNSTLEHLFSRLEEDIVETTDKNKNKKRVRSISVGENLESMLDFQRFYYSIKRQKQQVLQDLLVSLNKTLEMYTSVSDQFFYIKSLLQSIIFQTLLYIGSSLLKLRDFLSQEITEFFERNSLILEQKIQTLENDFEINSAPLKKRLSTAKDIGFSPKNHLKHFRKSSFKNPFIITHSQAGSDQEKREQSILEVNENSEENQEKILLKKVVKILIEIRVAIAPLNSKFFMSKMLFSKQNPRFLKLLNSEVSEKLRFEALKQLYQTETFDFASLEVYSQWKMKKWNAEHQREQVLKQKRKLDLQEFVICKICDQKVPEMNLLNHSGICKKLEDLKEISKKNLLTLSNKFQQAFNDFRRNQSIKATIIRNRMQRLSSKLRKLEKVNISEMGNEEESGDSLMKKPNIQRLSYLSEEEFDPNFSMENSAPLGFMNIHLIPVATETIEKKYSKMMEFKEDSIHSEDTPASMQVSIDFTHKLSKMRMLNTKKNEVYISKEEISVENTPVANRYQRRSCLELRERDQSNASKEMNEGEYKLKNMLDDETEKLKINKKVIKYLDLILDLLNVYITLSPEAPCSAYLKLQQYYTNNSKVVYTLKDWIIKNDPIKTYDDIWSKSDDLLQTLQTQNECYNDILEAEKEIKALAIPKRIKLRKSTSRKLSMSLSKMNDLPGDHSLTCKPEFSKSRKAHFSMGFSKHQIIRQPDLEKQEEEEVKKKLQIETNNNEGINFETIFENGKQPEQEKSAKEIRFSFQKSIETNLDSGPSKLKKNMFSFEEIGKNEENECMVVRKLKKTTTNIGSPPKLQERMSFLRNSNLNTRSKTHIYNKEIFPNLLAIPSYNIIENFVHDKNISFPSKKKALKQILDAPICLGGNYIESYNSDGALITLKTKRCVRKKSLSKNDYKYADKEDSDSVEDADLDVCYMSDQMETNHINAIKMKQNNVEVINIEDFTFLKLISKGAFGRVWLVKKKFTQDIYAMKIVNFAEKISKNHLDSLRKEQQVFSLLHGDFVVKALFTFSHENYIIFVMEYMMGGDLGSLLEIYTCFEENIAKFYIAEIILAVEYLHSLSIIHRDLKPDNLLLDSSGHIKLTDFGLSEVGFQIQKEKKQKDLKKKHVSFRTSFSKKQLQNNNNNSISKKIELVYNSSELKQSTLKVLSPRHFPSQILSSSQLNCSSGHSQNSVMKNPRSGSESQNVCLRREVSIADDIKHSLKPKEKVRVVGTPDYMAPEILEGIGSHGVAVDWWSVGVILFELIVGIPPFNDDSQEAIFQNIKEHKIPWEQIKIGDGDDCMSEDAFDLINKFLEPDPKKRLGTNGTNSIKNHPFFKDIDWENLRKKEAPVIPKSKEIMDTSNFNKSKQYEEEETKNPFFSGKITGKKQVREAIHILGNTNSFILKRWDLLHEENQKMALDKEAKKLKKLEEITKKEKELQKIENDIFEMEICEDEFQSMKMSFLQK